MNLVRLFIMSALLPGPGQSPTNEPTPSALAQDQELQAVLASARSSDQPQLKLLASRIDDLIFFRQTGNEDDFKLGAMSVLRHCGSSNDLVMREAYLRLLQYPVIEQVLASRGAVSEMSVDGSPRDWPKAAVVKFPNPAAKSDSPAVDNLRAFGALRDEDLLYIIIQTYKKPELSAAKVMYTIELKKLSTQFHNVDYTINILGHQVRIFNNEGQEVLLNEDRQIYMKTGTRAIEVAIPICRIEQDLRSFVIRGYTMEPREKIIRRPSLWIACPTGPVIEPLEMLIHFGFKRELPAANAIPVAIALQEGLLLSRSAPDLSERVKQDAYDWLQLALEINSRTELTDTQQPSKASFNAQLAWASRYDGHRALDSVEDYEFNVPTPQTLGDMRGYVEVNGWITSDTRPEQIRVKLDRLMADKSESYDYPDAEARQQAGEYQDRNDKAYYAKGGEKLLSYRDVGANQRWKFFEEGFGLKGSPAQLAQFQRLISTATALPALWGYRSDTHSEQFFTLNYDARRQKWFPVRLQAPAPENQQKIRLVVGRPWTRPERFDCWALDPGALPEGASRYLLHGDYDVMSNNQLSNVIQRGWSDNQLTKLLLPPMRLR